MFCNKSRPRVWLSICLFAMLALRKLPFYISLAQVNYGLRLLLLDCVNHVYKLALWSKIKSAF